MEKIGLIAGNRRFPFIFCEAARKRGYFVVAVAIKGDTLPALKKVADKIYWIGLHEFGRMFELFKSEGITKIVMAGQINPRRIFSKELNKDEELKQLLSSIKDKKADSIFVAIAKKLNDKGFELIDSTTFVEDHLPSKGELTKLKIDQAAWENINFGLRLAKEIAGLDVGQTVAVKDKAIVAVEALEGTDNLIRRAGYLTQGGFTMVKVSKPNQDMRFDIPVVGLNTIKNLVRAKAVCLAFEAGKTLFIDKEKSVELANRKNISIVAV